jgi:cytoplasmic polyadenylation element-binding protein
MYRNAAAVCDATCTWSGQLPPRNYKNPVYSCKVFVGGVPWDITEVTLIQAFKQFGTVHVEWPGREARYARAGVKPSAKGKGYVYVIFESEKSVKGLLQNCNRDFSNTGDWYFKLTTRRLRTKEIRQVQIIPWIISDSTCVRCNNQRMDPHKTIFVGALHGMITSEVLAIVMNDLFGGVVYAGVDTDKYKYPIGSGRVTFNNQKSYFKAVTAAFVEIKTPKFNKKVQIDPYLEDSVCSMCSTVAGPYFCREMMCFRYFCKTCWQGQHGTLEAMRYHKPLMRNTRTSATQGGTRRTVEFGATGATAAAEPLGIMMGHQAGTCGASLGPAQPAPLPQQEASGPIRFALAAAAAGSAATSLPPPRALNPANLSMGGDSGAGYQQESKLLGGGVFVPPDRMTHDMSNEPRLRSTGNDNTPITAASSSSVHSSSTSLAAAAAVMDALPFASGLTPAAAGFSLGGSFGAATLGKETNNYRLHPQHGSSSFQNVPLLF